MTHLMCDLDGTLISTRTPSGTDYICVSTWHNRPCFIRKDNLELLQGLSVIPVTSRSVESFRSITELYFPIALVDNGGTLLIDGEVDKEWESQSMHRINWFAAGSVFAQARSWGYSVKNQCRYGIDLIHPCKAHAIADLFPGYNQYILGTHGLYLEPVGLTKGVALTRYAEKYPGVYFAAGDTAIDDSMLAVADVSFGYENSVATNKFKGTGNPHDFANFVLTEARRLIDA